MATSLNGWPVLVAGDRRLKTITVPGTHVRLTVRDVCAPVFSALAADYNRLIEPLALGDHDDAGYAYRQARAADGWSNHSSATAIDLNWTGHGAQRLANRRWWQLTKPRTGVAVLQKRYPILTWGGTWSPKNWDPMHWEIKRGVTPKMVEDFIKRNRLE
jgi:hypothetical protein